MSTHGFEKGRSDIEESKTLIQNGIEIFNLRKSHVKSFCRNNEDQVTLAIAVNDSKSASKPLKIREIDLEKCHKDRKRGEAGRILLDEESEN